jgi:hypothetical protein
MLALGLGVVSSLGHGGHHDTIRQRDQIRAEGPLGRLPPTMLYLKEEKSSPEK